VSDARRLAAAPFAAVATILATAALAGCAMSTPASTDACAQAIERLTSECNFQVEGASGELNCTGSTACEADCLSTSPCDDIKKNGPTFSGCVKACAP
jgi:hypothetical protein